MESTTLLQRKRREIGRIRGSFETVGFILLYFNGKFVLLCLTVSQALAALVQGRACGLLATSSDLELDLLQTCFQLDDYDHLVKVLRKRMK